MAVNWPGLLAWSTKYHDGTKPSQFKQMSQEDREFLEQAMEAAFGKMEDPNKAFEEAISKLKDPESPPESIATSLEVIDRLCDDPDVARNAEKLDGIQPLLDQAKKDTPQRSRTLEILALLFSNNPKIQEAGYNRGGIQIMLEIMRAYPVGDELRVKSFRTLAALVRSAGPLEEALLRQHDGANELVGCLSLAEPSGMREKALSLLRSFAQEQRLTGEEKAKLSLAIAELFPGVASESIQYREMLASATRELARPAASEQDPALPAKLVDAVKLREQQLSTDASKGVEDDSNELPLLKECIEALAASA